MTQENKQLLLKDLCARLPYGVKGKVYAEVTNGKYDMNGEMIFYNAPFDVILDGINISTEKIHVVAIGNEDTVEFIEMQQTDGDPYAIDDFKPYLRPMSSMTEEEKRIMRSSGFELIPYDTGYTGFANIENYIDEVSFKFMEEFLNAHHLDYRELILEGLALEAPEGMYN